ncbi:MAG: methyltransferase domain-containing protein [Alphaproteobacteria bacterium]|nr:methyltransferase domain-containing protein [Alphaproteobacteria bacterium]
MTACQVCGGEDRRLFIRHGGYDLYECGGCRLVYCDPMPTAAEIERLYTDAYAGASQGYFAKVDAKLHRMRLRLRWILAASGLDPATTASGLDPATAARRFLDVGASGGFMVETARRAGLQATGLELDPVSVAYARSHYPGSDFVHGRIETLAATAPPAFDLVHCSEVIEHVTDVNAFVAGIVRVMKPGGFLYLTTPDLGHWRRPRDLTRWDAFAPPGHCLYFRTANLTRLLERHGLAIVKRRRSWKPGLRLLARRR